MYKLTRLLWLHIVTKFKEKELPASNNQIAKKLPDYIPKDNIGEEYRKQDSFQQEQVFKKTLEINPDNDSTHKESGLVYRNQGKFSKAEQLFKKAIELNPNHERLYGCLAIIYREMGNNELSEAYERKSNSLIDKYYNPATVNNYRILKQTSDKRKIRLVSVQVSHA